MRCTEFYERWKKDPNWCEKSPDTVNLISHYLALLDEMAALEIPNTTMVGLLPERSARPLFKVEDPKIKHVLIAAYLFAGRISEVVGKVCPKDTTTARGPKGTDIRAR